VIKRSPAIYLTIVLSLLGALSIALRQGLVLFVLMTLLGAIFWQYMAASRSLSLVAAVPLGALTVFGLTVPISLARAVFVEGGLTRLQGVTLASISLVALFALTLWRSLRSKVGLSLMQKSDLVPVVCGVLVALVGLFSTFLNRVTALAIFMAGGDHANHVGRAVSILNAGAAGSVERAAYLRPGGLNPLHFLAAELFSVQGGGAGFKDAPEFYLFFARFEWIQLGIWVLVTGFAAQMIFLKTKASAKLNQNETEWGLRGSALMGVFLLALPFVSSTGLLGFSTSVTVAWMVLAPAVLLKLEAFKFQKLPALFVSATILVALVAISIRSSNALQVMTFPVLVLAFLLFQTKRPRWSLKLVLALFGILIVVGLFSRVLAPYLYVFISAGNPTGTSSEPSFWLLLALLLVSLLGFLLRAGGRGASWAWAWVWSSVFGVLVSMTFLTLRFGSTPNDPDYLVSKTLFAAVAFVLPVAAGALMAIVMLSLKNVSTGTIKFAAIAIPVAVLLLLRPDAAWAQVFSAWSGQGHPMTWYSAAFSKGLPESSFAFSMKNRDAAWLAGLSFEAYSKPVLTYDQVITPNPVPGLCDFIEKNQIKVMVTDGFELQGALTDCPAAAGVSYVVPPRLVK